MLNCGMGKQCQGRECLECLNRRYALPKIEKAGMTSCYKLYVPECTPEYLYKVKKEILSIYGGFTGYKTSGGWVNHSGNVMEESITVLEVYSNKPLNSILRLAECIKHDLKQQCVSLVINNTMYFI